MLRAFEMGAEGVFIAGCGEQCARENTDFWIRQRVEKVRKIMPQIGLEPDRLRVFASKSIADSDPAREMDEFAEQIGGFFLSSIMMQEVRS